MKADCIYGTGEDDLPVRGEVDLGKLGFAAIILRGVHRHRKRFYLSFSRW
jgi:hypothetical protein